jgi:predicted nucleic acid-binding protein
MIHLDTNCLIGFVTADSPARGKLLGWLRSQEEFAASAIAWSEFLNGPVTQLEIKDAFEIVEGRIIPFDIRAAEIAATLFNEIGRKRANKPDCFIAATAIVARASLATLNDRDFTPFVSHGLHLA